MPRKARGRRKKRHQGGEGLKDVLGKVNKFLKKSEFKSAEIYKILTNSYINIIRWKKVRQ